MDHYTPIKW